MTVEHPSTDQKKSSPTPAGEQYALIPHGPNLAWMAQLKVMQKAVADKMVQEGSIPPYSPEVRQQLSDQEG